MDDAIGAFLEYLAVERGASPHTVRGYAGDLREFSAFLRRAGDLDPSAVVRKMQKLVARVEALAAETDLPAERLDRPIGDAPPAVRLRAHLAKALALGPRVVLLEHPTITLDPGDVRPFAETVKRVAEARGLTVVALTEDAVFADVAATHSYKLNGGTGALTSTRGWRRFLP